MIQKLWGGIRYLDEAGPSPKNINLLDMAAVPMLTAMRSNPMLVDLNHFSQLEVRLIGEMETLTDKVKSVSGYSINLDSGDQVSDLLFKKMGIKQARVKMTKSGDRESVEDEVLKAIQHEHPIVSIIQDYKELSKLLGTYVRPIPKLARKIREGEWGIYPQLGHTRVPSGRLNCREPNLLAIPNRTPIAREIPKGFPAPKGWVVLSVDESQIEVRAAAHRSQDPNLMAVYHDEQDIYYDFATTAFKKEDKRYKDEIGWHYPGIDKNKERFPSKTCTLASIYRVTAKGLTEQMPVVCKHCSVGAGEHIDKGCKKFSPQWEENPCQDMINSFYMRYRGLINMQKADDRTMMAKAMIWDGWGRILHVTAVRSVLEWVVSAALREGGNFPLQSLAQGTMKIVMGQFWEICENNGLLEVVKFCLQIHDEILMYVREDVWQDIAELLKEVFENCIRLHVPLKASAAMAHTWGDVAK